MKPFKKHKGIACPLNRTNIDTDQIIPKQFLKSIKRTGFGQYLFYHWRIDDEGNVRKDFILNDEMYKDASILLAGDNFGCGSSREHASWSLLEYGFQVVIAPSFADIFYNNALKNGLLPIRLEEKYINEWMDVAKSRSLTLAVDLQEQVVIDDQGKSVSFEIPEYHKEKLLNGLDDIALTLLQQEKITAYEELTAR